MGSTIQHILWTLPPTYLTWNVSTGFHILWVFNKKGNIMLVSTTRKLFLSSPALLLSRGLGGLPKYDEAANIGMKTLWPACLVILGIYGIGFYLNPVRTSSMDPNKWRKQ